MIVHDGIYQTFCQALIKAYRQIKIGNPFEDGIQMGPLIDFDAVNSMQTAIKRIEAEGGRILYGGQILTGGIYDTGYYVVPCVSETGANLPIVKEETFAPILYLI